MAKRDSDTDIRQLMPDLSKIMQRADPAYGEQLYREAMNNPELDEAVAERDRALAEMEAGEGAEGSDPAGKTTKTPATAVPRVSAPSPWANAASGDAIDPSVLPSATAPKTEAAPAAPPVTSAVEPKKRAAAGGSTRRTLPPWIFPGVVAITLAPFAMWAIMSILATRHPTSPVAGPGPSAEAGTSVSGPGTSVPSVSSSATAREDGPPPSAAAGVITASPITSAPPVIAPSAKRYGEPHPRPGAGVDGGAPSAPTSSAAVAPVPPPPVTNTPTTPPSATPFDPFLDKRPR